MADAAGTAGDKAVGLWDTFTRKIGEMTDATGKRVDEEQTKRQLTQIEDAVGRPVTKVILDLQDRVVLDVGDIITHRAVQQAHEAGGLDSLLGSVYKAEVQFEKAELRAERPGAGRARAGRGAGGAQVVEEMRGKVEQAQAERDAAAAQKKEEAEAARQAREEEREQRAAQREAASKQRKEARAATPEKAPSGAKGGSETATMTAVGPGSGERRAGVAGEAGRGQRSQLWCGACRTTLRPGVRQPAASMPGEPRGLREPVALGADPMAPPVSGTARAALSAGGTDHLARAVGQTVASPARASVSPC